MSVRKSISVLFISLSCLLFLWFNCTDPVKPDPGTKAKLTNKQIQTQGKPVVDSLFLLYVSVEGDPPFLYYWYRNDVKIPSANDSILSFDTLLFSDIGNYKCIVENDYGSDTSNVYPLKVFTLPSITTPDKKIQTSSPVPELGSSFYLYITATGSDTLKYQWNFNGASKSINNDTLPITSFSVSDTGLYQCIVKNDYGADSSKVCTLSLYQSQPPVVSDIPNQTIQKGDTFSVINLDDYVADPDDADSQIKWTASATTNITVTISTDRKATITANSADWVGSEKVTFTALDPDSLSDTDSAVFTISEGSLSPVVSDIPGQTVKKGTPFTVINLDDYVVDPDNTDDEITWTASATTNITVTISTDRKATINSNSADWTGSETVKFTAQDPDGLFDTCRTTFTVTENDPPVVSDIPDETIAEGGSFTVINLDEYVTDADNTDDQITWTASSPTNLTVTIDDINRQATITVVDSEWNGSEAVTFTATDPTSLSNSDNATFEVTAVNDQPLVSDIPNQTIAEGGSFTAIELDEFVSDVDNSDDEITWTASATINITVTINASRQATIVVVDPEWNGSETVIFTAKDPAELADTNHATFTVTVDDDPPIVSNIPDQTIAEGGSFTVIELDDYVTDADNTVDQITWTASSPTNLTVTIDTNRQATITVVDSEWNGSEAVTFTATDTTSLSNSDNATFEVTAVNDPPVITAQTTLTINEDKSQIISISSHLTIEDPDNTTFTGPFLSSGANYTFNGNTVTPSPDYHGTLTVPVTVGDGTNYSAPFDVTITVNSVNDKPSFDITTSTAVDEDAGDVTIPNFATNINRGAANEGSQTITFHISPVSPNFSAQPQISSNGTLTFSTKPDVYDTVVFDVYCTDGGDTANGGDATSDTTQFTIEVQSVNDNPVISAFDVVESSVNFGNPITINCTFSDIEENMLKLELYFDGSLVVTRNLAATQTSDNFTWTPPYSSSIIGSHDVNIAVYDGNGGSATSSNDVCSVAGNRLSDSLSVEALMDANGNFKNFTQCLEGGNVTIRNGGTRVYTMSFFANEISVIPPDIGNMNDLTYLAFSGDKLSSLPSELSKCTLINYIVFAYASFTSIPSVVYTLSNLTQMIIYDSPTLTGPVSPSIDNLSKLTEINLKNTNITSLPAEIYNCPVEGLDVSNTLLTTFPTGIGVWKDMSNLNFESCQVTTLPEDIKTVGDDNKYFSLHAHGNPPELADNVSDGVREWLNTNDPGWDGK